VAQVENELLRRKLRDLGEQIDDFLSAEDEEDEENEDDEDGDDDEDDEDDEED
jgi:hypothetical protein